MLAVNWEAISAIGQIVGAIAVVVSLIYLARRPQRFGQWSLRACERARASRRTPRAWRAV